MYIVYAQKERSVNEAHWIIDVTDVTPVKNKALLFKYLNKLSRKIASTIDDSTTQIIVYPPKNALTEGQKDCS